LSIPRLPIVALFVLAMIVAACGGQTAGGSQSEAASASAGASEAESAAPSESAGAEQPTDGRLAQVRERDSLICGVNDGLPGFGFFDENGENVGFDIDFCRAIAAAVLGDPTKVEFRPLDADGRQPAILSGEIDVLIRNTTWTVSRDTGWGLFAPTTFYDGQGMMVRAADGIETLEDLEGATICVQTGTTTEQNLADVFDELGIDITAQPFGDDTQTYDAYDEGSCDAVTSDRSQLLAQRTALTNPDEHVILEEVMSKEPLGPVVPFGDDEWFNIVKWTVYATIQAEELGITSENVADEAANATNPVVQRLLGVTPEGAEPFESGLGLEPDWVVDVISAVGNYGEIYDRNLGPGTPFELERGPNALWTEGGLMYAPPYR
jgi:general L-amino acid transport system substrate-binding protein